MDSSEYRNTIREMRVSRKLGQNFLVNKDVAKTEANFGIDRNVLELGPGLGILTNELCRVAKSVTAIEKDSTLFEFLNRNVKSKKLELINNDFFDVKQKKLSESDIMISNIPYSLSSKVIMWLGDVQMPAVLCLQKEFVEHMVSKPDTKNYSRLSVACSIQFNMTYIMDVPANDFYPQPKVNSAIVYLKPKNTKIPKKTFEILSLLMMHKKKKTRNALIDSARLLDMDKEELSKISEKINSRDKRVFQMTPDEILETSREISKQIKN
ncbi:MAG: 16S rRNA (adenine(1518)-N(6)/adenine(1519)-N(6))-dimethyltransferase RsmA [Candidatus Micrarchaeales archaeon]